MAIHPGKYLKDELVAQHLSHTEFARRMGMSLNAINQIINGKKAITAETALKLEEVLPIFRAEDWLNIQSTFQIAEALAARNSIK
jgi:addiction module HigA family antidote